MVLKKLGPPTHRTMIHFVSSAILALQSKFKNNIKFGTFSEFFNTKNTNNGLLQKIALAAGFVSIIGIIGILALLLLGVVQ